MLQVLFNTLFIPRSKIEEWVLEDLQYCDITTEALGIVDVEGVAEVVLRQDAVVACTEEAAEIYRILGARITSLTLSGTRAEKGSSILIAEGPARSLHAAWRVAQTIIGFASAVATYTKMMVDKAKSVNPRITIATTRKAPPGSKPLFFKAVLCGGGSIHRFGLSDSILVFDNHLELMGGQDSLEKAIEKLKQCHPERKIGVEVKNLEQALKAARAGAEYIQLEKMPPEKVRGVVEAIRGVNPHATIGVAGGITLENVQEYAKTGVDLIVTSAPYNAGTIDLTTKITPKTRNK